MVNTFLICSSFRRSASKLSDRHLFKQCVEAKQIISILEGSTKKGFANHPAVKQWIDYTDALKSYFNAHLLEVQRRNRREQKKTGKDKWRTTMALYDISSDNIVFPWFVFCKTFHYSHRASLKRKDPRVYSRLPYPSVYDKCGYFWPSKFKGSIDEVDQLDPKDICAPISKYLQSPVYCSAVLKSGKRKGENCGNVVKITGRKYIRLDQTHNTKNH